MESHLPFGNPLSGQANGGDEKKPDHHKPSEKDDSLDTVPEDAVVATTTTSTSTCSKRPSLPPIRISSAVVDASPTESEFVPLSPGGPARLVVFRPDGTSPDFTELSDVQISSISDITAKHATDKLITKSRYNGSAWFQVNHLGCVDDGNNGSGDDNDDGCVFRYDLHNGGLRWTMCGCVFQFQILSLLMRGAFLVLLWAVLWLVLPHELLELRGNVFDPLLTFVMCSLVGKLFGRIFSIPPLILIFFFGLLWGNVPEFSYLTSGISRNTKVVVTKVGLAVILLRTGLAISPKVLAPAKWNILAMSVFPLLTEVVVHGFVAKALFDFGDSQLWPFLQSMVAAPSASGVVAAVVMIIQHDGFSVTRGPGILLIPACALDMTLGIWGINFMASLIFRDPDSNLVWDVFQGPVQVIVGAIAGIALGFIWYGCVILLFSEAKPLPHGKHAATFVEGVSVHATVLLLAFSCFSIFFAYYIESAGGGCIAATMVGATVQYLCTTHTTTAAAPAPPPPPPASTANPTLPDVNKNDNNRSNGPSPTSSTTTVTTVTPQSTLPNSNSKNDDNKYEKGTAGSSSSSSSGGSELEYRFIKMQLVTNLAMLWDTLVMPAVFAFSGASIDAVSMFNPDTVGVAIATIIIGFIARSVVTGLCSWSYPMSMSEWMICSIALGGKAFGQVALGSIGKQQIAQLTVPLAANSTEHAYAGHVANTGALSVMLCSPVVVVLLAAVAPLCWYTDDEWNKKVAEEKEEEAEKSGGNGGGGGVDDALRRKSNSSSATQHEMQQEMHSPTPSSDTGEGNNILKRRDTLPPSSMEEVRTD